MIKIGRKNYYRPSEVARVIGVTRAAVNLWVKFGKIKHKRGRPDNKGAGDVYIEESVVHEFKKMRDESIQKHGRFKW